MSSPTPQFLSNVEILIPRGWVRQTTTPESHIKPVEVGAIHQLWRSEDKEGYDLCRDLLAEVVGLARVICFARQVTLSAIQ